jgi:daunorubicin/doxorubicin transport system permease protein
MTAAATDTHFPSPQPDDPRPRPAPPRPIAASMAFAWRAILKVKHVPEQALDVLAIPIVFTLMFTYLFGGAIAGSTAAYLQFLLPGTLVMTVLLLTTYTGVGLSTDIASGSFDRFRSMPIWRPAPVVGALIGDVGRYLIASALVLALGFAMGFRPGGGLVGVLAALGLTLVFAFALSWIWTTLGLLVRTPNAVLNLGLVLLFPITLASNAFVDPDTTPGWVQGIVHANPVTHLVTAVRALVDGSTATGAVVWVLVASGVLAAIFAPLTLHLLRVHE